MARVNIEDGAFGAAKVIAGRVGIHWQTMIGMLACLWRDSQAAEIVVARAEDLFVWMEGPESEVIDADALIHALQDTGIIRPADGGLWEIIGNQRHIDNLHQRKESARLGGLKSGVIRSKRPVEPYASTEHEATLEPITEQNRTEQNKEKNTSISPDGSERDSEADQPPKDPKPPRKKFDFEPLYREYPRKEGKAGGIAQCKAQIRTESDYVALRKAIGRYRDLCEREGTEKRFIKLFSSFLGTKSKPIWRDYLEADVGTSDVPSGPGSGLNWGKVFGDEPEAPNGAQ